MQTTPSSNLTATVGGAENPHWITMLEIDAKARHQAESETEARMRTYVQSPKQSAEKKYDDRLHIRLGCGKTKAYELLKAWELGREGGLRHQRIGNKYIVTEQAVREYFGDFSTTTAAAA